MSYDWRVNDIFSRVRSKADTPQRNERMTDGSSKALSAMMMIGYRAYVTGALR